MPFRTTALAIVGNERQQSYTKQYRHTHIFHNLTKSLGEAEHISISSIWVQMVNKVARLPSFVVEFLRDGVPSFGLLHSLQFALASFYADCPHKHII